MKQVFLIFFSFFFSQTLLAKNCNNSNFVGLWRLDSGEVIELYLPDGNGYSGPHRFAQNFATSDNDIAVNRSWWNGPESFFWFENIEGYRWNVAAEGELCKMSIQTHGATFANGGVLGFIQRLSKDKIRILKKDKTVNFELTKMKGLNDTPLFRGVFEPGVFETKSQLQWSKKSVYAPYGPKYLFSNAENADDGYYISEICTRMEARLPSREESIRLLELLEADPKAYKKYPDMIRQLSSGARFFNQESGLHILDFKKDSLNVLDYYSGTNDGGVYPPKLIPQMILSFIQYRYEESWSIDPWIREGLKLKLMHKKTFNIVTNSNGDVKSISIYWVDISRANWLDKGSYAQILRQYGNMFEELNASVPINAGFCVR